MIRKGFARTQILCIRIPPAAIVLCIVSLSGCAGGGMPIADDCGRIIRQAEFDSVIYAYCPSLPRMSPEAIAVIIDKVFEDIGGIDRETIVYFFNDDAIVAPPGGWPADYLRRVESWGVKLVGWYYSHGNTVVIRDTASGEWREIELPLPNSPSAAA